MNIEEIKKDYFDGLKYKDIQEKHDITYNKLLYLIQKNKWKRPSNRSKVQKGNKNAKGNKGGRAPKKNKNAFKTGEYENIFSSLLSKEEEKLFNNFKIQDKKKALLEELKILTIREHRMFSRIKGLQEKNKDMTVQSISKTNTQNEHWTSDTITTHTQIENTTIAIQRIEEALTRVQEAKRRCIDSLNKIGLDEKRMSIEKEKLKLEQKRLELELQNAEGEEIEDLTETDSDIYGSS